MRVPSMYFKKLRLTVAISIIFFSSNSLSMDAAPNPSCQKPNQSTLKSLLQWIVSDELTITEKCTRSINDRTRKREIDHDYFGQSVTDQDFRQKRAKIGNSIDSTDSIIYRNLSTEKNSSSMGITTDLNKKSGTFTTIHGTETPK